MGEASEGASKQEAPFLKHRPELRVKAVLSVAKEPISRQMALNFAGVKEQQVAKMNDQEKEALDRVFADERLKRDQKPSTDDATPTTFYSFAKDTELQVLEELKAAGIDPRDARQQIISYFMPKFGRR